MGNIQKEAKEMSQFYMNSFLSEVDHLLKSGGIDSEMEGANNIIFKVALENVAEKIFVSKNNKDYKNLKYFYL